MLNQDYTAKLLNLEDVIITNVENLAEELHVYIELPRKEYNCLKFKFKDANGHLNVDYTEDYVLAGVAFEGTEPPMDSSTSASKKTFKQSMNFAVLS